MSAQLENEFSIRLFTLFTHKCSSHKSRLSIKRL